MRPLRSLRPVVAWKDALSRRVVQEPLFDTRSSLAGLRRASAGEAPRTIFMGLGLCAARGELTRAVPLDILGMLLPAELARQATGAQELLVLIADRHALDNGLDPSRVRARAEALEAVLERVRVRCRLPALRFIRATGLHAGPHHRRTLERVRRLCGDSLHDYVLRQFADVLCLEEERGPLLKVGWALPSEDPLGQRDERMLDETMSRATGAKVGFVYCKPARTLSDASPRMPPYVVKRPEARLCLDRPEDPSAKLAAASRASSAATVCAFRNHLRRLVYTYGRVVTPLPRAPLEQRVDALLRSLRGPELD